MLTLKSCIPGNSSVPGKMIHLAHPSVSLASLIAPMCSKPICPPTLTSLATLSLEGRQDSTPLPNSAHSPPLPEAATTNPGALATALFGPPSLRAGFPVRANSEGLREWGAGGGARRGGRHLGGRETIGRKLRGTGLRQQVIPAFLGLRPCLPGDFGGGFLWVFRERSLWSLGVSPGFGGGVLRRLWV